MSGRSLFRALGLGATFAFALAGCGGEDTGDTASTTGTTTTETAPATGTALFTFSVSNGVRESPALVDPLKGPVYGAVFKQEDVTIAGPIEGAEELASVQVADVDLVDVDVSAASWQSEEIEAGAYVFLGFFDLDGNGEGEPDEGDPVTLPSVNEFEIVAGEETELTVRFDLVFN